MEHVQSSTSGNGSLHVALSSPGARVEEVGDWLWITFRAKPAEEVREGLKAAGFRWSQRKAAWYLMGTLKGRLRRASLDDLRARHGSKLLHGEEVD